MIEPAKKLSQNPDADIPDRRDRGLQFQRWTREYEVTIVNYPSVTGVLVKVADKMFTEHCSEFPSEALFATIALLVNSGVVPRRCPPRKLLKSPRRCPPRKMLKRG